MDNVLKHQVYGQIWEQIRSQIWGQVQILIWDQVWMDVGNLAFDRVYDQLCIQLILEIGSQIKEPMGVEVRTEIIKQVRNACKKIESCTAVDVAEQVIVGVECPIDDLVVEQGREQIYYQIKRWLYSKNQKPT